MSVPVVIITLSARARHGKDTFADIGIETGGTAKLALADWLKESSSKVLGIPLDRFYGGKDVPFDQPMPLTQGRLRNMLAELKAAGCKTTGQLGTSKWEGRQFKTARDFLVWYSERVVKPLLGQTIYCQQLEKRFRARLETDQKTGSPYGALVYFITDCRFGFEVDYMVKAFPGQVYPVKIVRPSEPAMDHLASERSVDEIDESKFFQIVRNDGTLADFRERVLSTFGAIKAQLTAGSTAVPSQAQQTAGNNRLAEVKKRFPGLGDNPTPQQIREAVLAAERKQKTAPPVAENVVTVIDNGKLYVGRVEISEASSELPAVTETIPDAVPDLIPGTITATKEEYETLQRALAAGHTMPLLTPSGDANNTVSETVEQTSVHDPSLRKSPDETRIGWSAGIVNKESDSMASEASPSTPARRKRKAKVNTESESGGLTS